MDHQILTPTGQNFMPLITIAVATVVELGHIYTWIYNRSIVPAGLHHSSLVSI